jgi:putative hydrolase of the HAD superfamily
VLFDAVGTLIAPHPSVAEVYQAAGRRFGSRLEIDQVRSRFREAFGRQEQLDAADARTSEERERRRWQTIVAEVFCDVGDARKLFESLWDHFAQAAHWKWFDDVPRVVQRLRDCGVRWGVASNFDARLATIINGLSPLSSCEHLFVSSRLGCRKPSVAFFQAIERSLGLPPEQLLLVGDDLENDYHGARAAGWQAVLLDRDAAAPADVEHRITSLAELDIASYST